MAAPCSGLPGWVHASQLGKELADLPWTGPVDLTFIPWHLRCDTSLAATPPRASPGRKDTIFLTSSLWLVSLIMTDRSRAVYQCCSVTGFYCFHSSREIYVSPLITLLCAMLFLLNVKGWHDKYRWLCIDISCRTHEITYDKKADWQVAWKRHQTSAK